MYSTMQGIYDKINYPIASGVPLAAPSKPPTSEIQVQG